MLQVRHLQQAHNDTQTHAHARTHTYVKHTGRMSDSRAASTFAAGGAMIMWLT